MWPFMGLAAMRNTKHFWPEKPPTKKQKMVARELEIWSEVQGSQGGPSATLARDGNSGSSGPLGRANE